MDDEKNKKQYFNEINIMRGMAVLCVVIGHSFDATATPTILGFLKSFVYCFHMPAFFFISGFLVKDYKMDLGQKAEKIKLKAKRLMVPYIFLTLVTIILKMVFGAFARNPLDYSTLIVDVLIGRNNPNGGLWFLYALFAISVIGILLNNIDVRITFGISVLLNILNSLVFNQEGHILAFVLIYSMYYLGGTVVRRYIFPSEVFHAALDGKTGKTATLIILIAYVFLAYIEIYMLDNWVYSLLITVAGVIILFNAAYVICGMGKEHKFWMTLGNFGMDIYMIGYYVQQAIYVVLGKMLGIDYLIYSWCMCIFGLLLPIVLSKYVVRKSKVLSLLILGQ